MDATMKTYKVGTRVFCDFHFGGKPRGIVRAVLKPGRGNVIGDSAGKVTVELTETVGAYKKGELLNLSADVVVPVKQEFRKPGSYFRWVNTDYKYE